ncbi:hypothetical protein Tco_0188306, partial [Tanacetum coccineum]
SIDSKEYTITEASIRSKLQLADAIGIHNLSDAKIYVGLDASNIYMLVDRKYSLSKDACQVMLKMKLLDGIMDEVCYQLLKMIEKQAGIRK